MEMGLEVLVEKPMAKSLAEADALLDAAKRYRRLLQIGHVERFNPAVLAVEPILNHPLFSPPPPNSRGPGPKFPFFRRTGIFPSRHPGQDAHRERTQKKVRL